VGKTSRSYIGFPAADYGAGDFLLWAVWAGKFLCGLARLGNIDKIHSIKPIEVLHKLLYSIKLQIINQV
jgi:hypothetical protein